MAPRRQDARHPWSSCEVQNERMIGNQHSNHSTGGASSASPQHSARWRTCNAVGIARIAHLSEPADHQSTRVLGSSSNRLTSLIPIFLSHLSPDL
jgi:hypothetical protein